MAMKKFLSILFAISILTTLSLVAQNDLPKAGKYRIIAEESRIEAKTGSSGLLSFAGHPHTITPTAFSGEVDIKPGDANAAIVSLKIQAPSLREAAEFEAKEKQEIESQLHGPVLETSKYPEITFESTNVKYSEGAGHVYDAQIEGNLTLHGVSQKITVPARITMNGEALRATGNFKINRPDFKIETKSAGGGTVKVAKTIDINFVLVLKP